MYTIVYKYTQINIKKDDASFKEKMAELQSYINQEMEKSPKISEEQEETSDQASTLKVEKVKEKLICLENFLDIKVVLSRISSRSQDELDKLVYQPEQLKKSGRYLLSSFFFKPFLLSKVLK